jgi:hypothetical protein
MLFNFFNKIHFALELRKFNKLNDNKIKFQTPKSVAALKHIGSLLRNRNVKSLINHYNTEETLLLQPISSLESIHELVTYINPYCVHPCNYLIPKKYLNPKLRKALVGYGHLHVPFNSRISIYEFNEACITAIRILKTRKKYINKVLVMMYRHSLEPTSNKLSVGLLVRNLKFLEKQKLKSHLNIADESNIFTTRYY